MLLVLCFQDQEEVLSTLTCPFCCGCRGDCKLREACRRVAEQHSCEGFEELHIELLIDKFAELIEIDQSVLLIARALQSNYKMGIRSNTVHEYLLHFQELGIYEGFRL